MLLSINKAANCNIQEGCSMLTAPKITQSTAPLSLSLSLFLSACSFEPPNLSLSLSLSHTHTHTHTRAHTHSFVKPHTHPPTHTHMYTHIHCTLSVCTFSSPVANKRLCCSLLAYLSLLVFQASITMQEARMLVPSFGSWDTGTEIPFTTVFEKVRATKDAKPLNAWDKPSQTPGRHVFEGNPSMIHPQYEGDKFSNVSSELHRGKRSVLDEWGFQRKASDLQSSSSRRSSLEQIADHIFAESQHAAGNESPVISRQSTSSNTSWQNNQPICSRDLREQYVKENMYNQPMPSGLPSVYHQGYQVICSRMPGSAASPRRERLFPNGIDDTRSSYPMPTIRLHQKSLQANHLNTEMPQNKVLPKFGDWDAIDPTGVEFTVIFDKARNERKGSINQDSSLRNKADAGVDEDLYKPTSTQRRSGFWALLCCSHSSVS